MHNSWPPIDSRCVVRKFTPWVPNICPQISSLGSSGFLHLFSKNLRVPRNLWKLDRTFFLQSPDWEWKDQFTGYPCYLFFHPFLLKWINPLLIGHWLRSLILIFDEKERAQNHQPNEIQEIWTSGTRFLAHFSSIKSIILRCWAPYPLLLLLNFDEKEGAQNHQLNEIQEI